MEAKGHVSTVALLATVALGAVGCSAQTAATDVAAEGPGGSAGRPNASIGSTTTPSTAVATSIPTVDQASLSAFQHEVSNSPYENSVDRVRPTSLAEVAKSCQIVVTGVVTSASESTGDRLNLLPGQENLPNGKDLIQRGLNLTVVVEDVRARPGGDPPQTGQTITVRIPMWTGQRGQEATAGPWLRKALDTAPVGAMVTVLLPKATPLSDGSFLSGPQGIVLAGSPDGVGVVADEAMAEKVGAKRFAELTAEAKLQIR